MSGKISHSLRFVTFPATEYHEIFSGYQPGGVGWGGNIQGVFGHLCPRPQGTSLVAPLNHLPRLIARENFIKPEFFPPQNNHSN
jgi:hypothetical protein